MLDYFWAVLLGYTFAMFCFPLVTFFYVRGKKGQISDYYYNSQGEDWDSATIKACFGAVAVVQAIIFTFIIQHFREDCKEVFSGRAYKKEKERQQARQTMNKQRAKDISDQIQVFKKKRIESIYSGNEKVEYERSPGIFGGMQKVPRHVINTDEVENMLLEKAKQLISFSTKNRIFERWAEMSKEMKRRREEQEEQSQGKEKVD